MKQKAMNPARIEKYLQLPYSILLHTVEDESEKYWIAEIPELPGCKSHGATVEEAIASLDEAKKDWIQDSIEHGEEIPLPLEREKYSGKILLRMSPSLHRALALMSEAEKTSLNQVIVTLLSKEISNEKALNRVEKRVDELITKMNEILDERQKSTISDYFKYFHSLNERQWLTPMRTAINVEVYTSVDRSPPVVTAGTLSELEQGRYSPLFDENKNTESTFNAVQTLKTGRDTVFARG